MVASIRSQASATEAPLSSITTNTHVAFAAYRGSHSDPLLARRVEELRDFGFSLFREDSNHVLSRAVSQVQISAPKTADPQSDDRLARHIIGLEDAATIQDDVC